MRHAIVFFGWVIVCIAFVTPRDKPVKPEPLPVVKQRPAYQLEGGEVWWALDRGDGEPGYWMFKTRGDGQQVKVIVDSRLVRD